MSETIPRDLAQALIDLDGADNNIVVGNVPPNFPRDIDVAHFKVLGYASPTRQHSISVFASDKQEVEVTSEFLAALLAAGFEAPPPVIRSGFGSADRYHIQPFHRADCVLMYSTRPRAGNSTLLTVRVMPPMPKEREGMRERLRLEREQAPMPLLADPPGAHSRGGGGGSSRSFSQIDTELTPLLQLTPTAAHYDEQLRQQRWENLASDIGASEAYMCYKLIDNNGSKWCGALTITARSTDNSMYVAFALFDLKAEAADGGGLFTSVYF